MPRALLVAGALSAISRYYGVSMVEAIQIENTQVSSYCPTYWPNLVAIGSYWRASDSGERGGMRKLTHQISGGAEREATPRRGLWSQRVCEA